LLHNTVSETYLNRFTEMCLVRIHVHYKG